MDAHTAAVIGLAWSRGLSLSDDAAFSRAGERALVRDDALSGLEFVELFGASALRGPGRLVDVAAQLPSAAFLDGTAVAAVAEDQPGTGTRTAARERLAFRDHYAPAIAPGAAVPVVSRSAHDAARVLDASPADDRRDILRTPGAVAAPGAEHDPPESAPPHPAQPCTLVLDDESRVALAGYTAVHHLLADLRVVTAPGFRRRGHARTIVDIAVGEALDSGLICQARIRVESTAAAALADSLGFTDSGSRVVIVPGRAYDH
ncbi:GNAT family N-acetyltransferase [Tomitella cavernea]|uniref:N-acetyltransferase domain-containing protein n=1 Tax=Tomitella cavernea TaxID=1387982 RepID=A0ABP9CKV1_9ACTN|nr:GNAT family N-acetyltransferase [Tomitella cavernea]